MSIKVDIRMIHKKYAKRLIFYCFMWIFGRNPMKYIEKALDERSRNGYNETS